MKRKRHTGAAVITVAGLALTACGGGTATAPTTTAKLLTKNGILGDIKKGAQDVGGALKDAGNDAGNVLNDVGNQAASGLSAAEQLATDSSNAIQGAYKNASNQIVDALGNLVSQAVSLRKFPDQLSDEVLAPMVGGVNSQLQGIVPSLSAKVKSALGSAAANFDRMTAAEAERTINGVLSVGEKVTSAKINIKIPGEKDSGIYKIPSMIAPYTSPFKVKVKENEWNTKKAVNVIVELDFLGLKKYEVGLACLGWPDGLEQTPTFVLNGGCSNPWGAMFWPRSTRIVSEELLPYYKLAYAKAMPEITKMLRKVTNAGANPRSIPPIAIDIPLNELIDAILNREVPSMENMIMAIPFTFDLGAFGSLTVSGSDFNWAQQPDDNKDGKKEERDKKKKDQGEARRSGNGGTGAGFSLYPQLEVDARVDANWTKLGQIQLNVGMGYFGISLFTVGMSCLTFGTTWKSEPTITFNGGCDNVWNIEGPSQSYFTPA